ncbi:hypothetical protein [Galactobacter valiniphilus]|uniref:hypothetical protein n=1 Tax=Galactobacter valiniphilus TaxID=2676122 RepID=UPI00373616DD
MSAPVPGPRPAPPAETSASSALDTEALLAPLQDLDELAPADLPERFASVLESLTAFLEEGA